MHVVNNTETQHCLVQPPAGTGSPSPGPEGCQPALLASLQDGSTWPSRCPDGPQTWSSRAVTALGQPSRAPGTVNIPTPPHPYNLAAVLLSATVQFSITSPNCALEKESQSHRVKWMIWSWQEAEIAWKLPPFPRVACLPRPQGAGWEEARVAQTWPILRHYISLWSRKPFFF